MSTLLNIARARDDRNFVLRVTAALQVQAGEEELKSNASPADFWLAESVYGNSDAAVQRTVNLVAADSSIAGNIKTSDPGGAIDVSGVSDDDIQKVVAQRWRRLADFLYQRERPNTTG